LSFTFANPWLLSLLLLIPLASFLKGKRGGAPGVRFSSVSSAREVGALPRSRAGQFLAALRLLGLACLIVALARPQIGRGTTEIEASGIDILLAIDVSTSMKALDFMIGGQHIDRLSVVKRTVKKFVKERPNDRIGLLAFAAVPYSMSPLTLDHDWLEQRLDSVTFGQVEDGTAIGSAIVASLNHLRDQKAKSRILILLTDGVNNSGDVEPSAAAEAAEALGIKIYTIGAGTMGRAPYPAGTDFFGRPRTQQIEVEIDEETLHQVAQKTGGKYYRATDTRSLETIYGEINKLETTVRKVKKYQSFEELFFWALLPGLFLIAGEIALSETRYRRLP